MSIIYNNSSLRVSTLTAGINLSNSHLDSHVNINSSSGVTIIIPSGVGSIGQTVDFFQMGAGKITFSGGGGVSLLSLSGVTTTKNQYAAATIRMVSNNAWALLGDLT